MIEQDYNSLVREKLLALIQKTDSLTEIASKADGVTPFDIIRIFGKDHFLTSNTALFNRHSITLPEPNPIDFEWRFTKDTSDKIIRLICSKNINIGLFGVPSVFFQLDENKKDKTLLFDINPYFTKIDGLSGNKIISCNLDSAIIEGYQFDIIIMDPPWYFKSYSNWIKQALNNLKSTGKIYSTKIPPLLRPDVIDNWNMMLDEFGNDISIIETSETVFYESPFFEIESIYLQGIRGIGNWRNTRLIEIEKRINRKYSINPIHNQDKWKRYYYGSKSVAMKVVAGDIGTVGINSPYSNGNFTLESISSRDEVRKKINFITSRNKALKVSGTEKVDVFLRNLESTLSLQQALDNGYSSSEVNNLKLIVALIGI